MIKHEFKGQISFNIGHIKYQIDPFFTLLHNLTLVLQFMSRDVTSHVIFSILFKISHVWYQRKGNFILNTNLESKIKFEVNAGHKRSRKVVLTF